MRQVKGDYAEAEKLYKRAVELGEDIAEKNLENLEKKKKASVEERQSWERATVLFIRESKAVRRTVARIYNEKLDNELILFTPLQMTNIFDGDINQLLREITNKKYFEIVDEHNFSPGSIVLRLNPLITDQVQKELRDEQKEIFFDDLSTSLTANELEEKYNYDEGLISLLKT